MTRIAHLTDLHLLEERHARRDVLSRARLRYLSFGRALVPDERRRRAAEAIANAKAFDPHHLVITGDLTEDGTLSQFELAAEILSSSGIPTHKITIVPGNHDVYAHEDAWQRALDGPLRPYRIASQRLAPIVLDDVAIVPLSTVFYQPYTMSAGYLSQEDVDRIRTIVRDPHFTRKAVVLAQHHPPFRYACTALQWIDGFRSYRAEHDLLHGYPNTFVMHGHIHSHQTFVLEPQGCARVFAGDAVVTGRPSLRMYEAGAEQFAAVGCGAPAENSDHASTGAAVDPPAWMQHLPMHHPQLVVPRQSSATGA